MNPEEDGVNIDLDSQRKGKCVVLKTSTRQQTTMTLEVDEKPTEDYNDIGGLEKQIQELVEAIVLPMTQKERFQKLGVRPPKGVLLYGPPGTGKTLMAHACAAQTNTTFLKLAVPSSCRYTQVQKMVPQVSHVQKMEFLHSRGELCRYTLSILEPVQVSLFRFRDSIERILILLHFCNMRVFLLSMCTMEKAWSVTEKCSQSTLRTVAELSLGNEKKFHAAVDEATLKTLGVSEPHGISHLPNDTSERSGAVSSDYTRNFSSEINILGDKTPLDLTLKKTMRLVSSSSVIWCHKLSTSSTYNGVTRITSQSDSSENQDTCSSLGKKSTAATLFSKSLHSWVYPQSSLPHSVISAMTLFAG